MKNITTLIFLTLFSNVFFSQKFEGVITYSIDYELPEIMEAQRSMLPSEMNTYCKKKTTRVEQKTAMGDQIVISSTKTGESTLLMNMMGQKMAIEVGNQKDNKNESIPSIVYSQESKTIAGYLCEKATYTVYSKEQQDSISMDLYYTTKIPALYNQQFKELKGIPLEYTINTQGMSMTFEATKIESKKLSKSLFNIPREYETISLEEFKKMMGQ